LRKDGFLLIDEPTNHLDEEAKESIARYLAKKDGFILVSHDRALLDRSVDHLLVIEKSKIYLEDGNYSSWWNNKNMREKGERVRSVKLENEIGRLKEARNKNIKRAEKAEKSKNEVGKSGLRPDKGYIGHKAAKLMQRAKNNERKIISSIESKQSLLKDVYIDDPLSFKVLKGSKDPLLSLNNVDIYRGGLSVAKNISFEIDEGDVVALKGRNGSGKTSLILALIDKKIALKGNVYIAKDIAISYIPQNYSALEGNSTTLAKDLSLDSSLVNSLAIKMGFKRESLNKEISELSPGEARKLLLALSLATPANLFIWDEPFNFIDITTREQIEEAISLYRPTILFVDHDEKFEEKVATRFVVLD
jgi:lincosamide and streptogramin A transport system ATP-binding/permease protein